MVLRSAKGNAEFNEAILRGTLTSGRVEASHIVAPIITLPTQAGERFQTHFLNRHIKPAVTSHDHHKLVLGLIVVQMFMTISLAMAMWYSLAKIDMAMMLMQNKMIFTRFRATAPLIKLALRFANRLTNGEGDTVTLCCGEIAGRQ